MSMIVEMSFAVDARALVEVWRSLRTVAVVVDVVGTNCRKSVKGFTWEEQIG